MKQNQFILPIDIRSSDTTKGKYRITGKARLVPGKQYSYLFNTDTKGVPINSLKEIISEKGWAKIKHKILSKQVFVDESHKTVSEMNVNRYLNDLSRETGKDLNEFKEKINKWMKTSEMPLFKLENAQLDNDYLALDIIMNPYFRDIDTDHAAYFDATWNSVKEGFLNSISLNFNPTEVTQTVLADGTYIPIIEDMDVYGISLVSNPAHDDMHDVLEVAVRSAQNVIENRTGGNMTDETKEQIKKEVKDELKADDLRIEVEKLRKENSEKETLLKQKVEAENEAERQKLIEEKNKLQAELESRNKQLSMQTPSRGLTPQPFDNIDAQRQRILHSLKPIEESKSLGKAIALQAEFNGLNSLPPETREAMGLRDDIRITAKQ